MRTTSERDTPPRHGALRAEFHRVLHSAKTFIVIETRDEGHALIEITLRLRCGTCDRSRMRTDACKQWRGRLIFRIISRLGPEPVCSRNYHPKNTNAAKKIFHWGGVEILGNQPSIPSEAGFCGI
jgi:hypothetical protein